MFINWELRELHAKIVYYGPPLGGKTTNIEQIHARIPEKNRSELVSVKTRNDRTLFFDFMQMELNEINGLRPKFKLYTVPGQVYYEATRKLVLRDVDGVVFVADSSIQRLKVNHQTIQDMWRQLGELGKPPKDIPFVLQCNKQDLVDAVETALLARVLGVTQAPIIPAIAMEGKGTAETLKNIIGQIIKKL